MAYGSSSFGSETYGGERLGVNTNSAIYTLNGVLLKIQSKTINFDAAISKQFTLTYSFDVALLKTQTENIDIDAAISKQFTLTYSFDVALLKTNITPTFTIDAKLIAVFERDKTFTIDALTSYKEQIYQMQADIADLKANGGGGAGDVVNGTLYNSDGIKNW